MPSCSPSMSHVHQAYSTWLRCVGGDVPATSLTPCLASFLHIKSDIWKNQAVPMLHQYILRRDMCDYFDINTYWELCDYFDTMYKYILRFVWSLWYSYGVSDISSVSAATATLAHCIVSQSGECVLNSPGATSSCSSCKIYHNKLMIYYNWYTYRAAKTCKLLGILLYILQ